MIAREGCDRYSDSNWHRQFFRKSNFLREKTKSIFKRGKNISLKITALCPGGAGCEWFVVS
jgi:hypothetical protein